MPKYELSISADYVQSWGKVEGIRELFQNALDEETSDPSNKMFFDYSSSEETLWIGNKNSTLDIQTLLIGNSSKREEAKYIGQHGEGYKIATIVLLREGCTVTFYNYNLREIWKPRLVKSRRYNGALVPTFFVEKEAFWKQVPEQSLIIEVKGISIADYQAIKASNLHLQQSYESHKTRSGDVLLSEQHAHKVYVSGLYVCDDKDLKYGYNLLPSQVKLDRDRRMVGSGDLLFATAEIILATDNETLIKECVKIYDGKYMQYKTYSYNKLQDTIATAFYEEHGSNATPVTNEAEAVSARKQGLRAVVVSDNERSIIVKSEVHASYAPKTKSLLDRIEEWFEQYSEDLCSEGLEVFEELLEELREEL